jgi:hypothetical protein
MNPMTLHIANITSILFCHLNIDYYMPIPISALDKNQNSKQVPTIE